jgi:hypothetical protein
MADDSLQLESGKQGSKSNSCDESNGVNSNEQFHEDH